MGYTFFRALKPEWELAACWQSILKFRSFIEPSQEEIAEMLKIGKDGFPGIDIPAVARKMGVASIEHIKAVPIKTDEGMYASLEDNVDLIVAYDGEKMTGRQREPVASFGLWIGYNSSEATIQSPNCREPFDIGLMPKGSKSGLIDCMQAKDDSRYGVYIVNSK